MNQKTGIPWIVAAVLAAVVLLAAGGPDVEGADQAKLPGDAGPGPYASGCVDCHTAGGAEDMGALLKAMGHRNVDEMTETVPGDCADCHSEDGGYSLLGELSHIFHYENPAENAFIKDYGGNCLHCHALDTRTGEVTVKSGAKNW